MPQYWEAWRNDLLWERRYNDWLQGAIEFDPDPKNKENPYTWILYIINGPNLDIGVNATLMDAMAAADYNARSNYVRRRVIEYSGGLSIPREERKSVLARLAYVKPYVRH